MGLVTSKQWSLLLIGTNSNVTAITDTQEEGNILNIYPNPANDSFTLKTNRLEKDVLKIIDLNGKTVLEQTAGNLDQINVSRISPGLYIVQIGTAHQKLIVE